MGDDNGNGVKTYFILSPASRAVKIGVSTDPVRRLRALQTAHHEKLVLLGDLSGNKERELHGLLSGFRKHGEWFDAAEPDVQQKIRSFGIKIPGLSLPKEVSRTPEAEELATRILLIEDRYDAPFLPAPKDCSDLFDDLYRRLLVLWEECVKEDDGGDDSELIEEDRKHYIEEASDELWDQASEVVRWLHPWFSYLIAYQWRRDKEDSFLWLTMVFRAPSERLEEEFRLSMAMAAEESDNDLIEPLALQCYLLWPDRSMYLNPHNIYPYDIDRQRLWNHVQWLKSDREDDNCCCFLRTW